jgi:hypothetical protein
MVCHRERFSFTLSLTLPPQEGGNYKEILEQNSRELQFMQSVGNLKSLSTVIFD